MRDIIFSYSSGLVVYIAKSEYLYPSFILDEMTPATVSISFNMFVCIINSILFNSSFSISLLEFVKTLFATYFMSSLELNKFSYFIMFSRDKLFLFARPQILLYVLFGISNILAELYISSIFVISVFKENVISTLFFISILTKSNSLFEKLLYPSKKTLTFELSFNHSHLSILDINISISSTVSILSLSCNS